VADSRPLLRTAGVALLGVGVVAATIGLFTSASSGNGTGTAVPSSSSQALAPSAAGTLVPAAPEPTAPVIAEPAPASLAPGATAAPAVPDGAPPSAPAAAEPRIAAPVPVPVAPPAGSGPASGSGSGSGGSDARAPLRVYNNSLIQGLAAKAKSDFESAGWTVTDISGYPGAIPHSTVYFRPGTGEEAAAQELGKEFGLRVEPRFPGIAQSSDGVIVIVTEDYKPSGKS
jgi:LytR cell envelope-related transcriptional attenuator